MFDLAARAPCARRPAERGAGGPAGGDAMIFLLTIKQDDE